MAAARMGLKFKPSDEVNMKYLMGKVLGSAWCDDFIRTVDLYGEQEPWEIFRDWEGRELYVFTPLKKVGNQKTGQRISRNVGQGVWSNKGQKDAIFGGKSGGKLVGHKRCFRYERKKKDVDQGKGNWLLKEYTLPDRVKSRVKEEYRDYALCVLKRKTDGGAGRRKNLDDVEEIGFEEMVELVCPQAAVPSCGGGGGGDEEEWLQMIDWNVEPAGGDFGGFDQVVEPAAAGGGDQGVVDWNGADFGFGAVDSVDEEGNVVVPCGVEGLFGIDEADRSIFSRRLSAPLVPL